MPIRAPAVGRTAAVGRLPAVGRTASAGRVAANLLNSLVSYWKLDEASGNAVDAHGSNTLTATNNPLGVAGKINNARQFVAASSQYLSVTSNSSLQGSGSFAISGWVYLDSLAATRSLSGKYAGVGDREWIVRIFTNGAISFIVSADGASNSMNIATAAGVITTAAWYFVVAQYDHAGGAGKIYANNTEVMTAVYSGGVWSSGTAPFKVGAYGPGGSQTEPMDGRIDEVGFWKRVLTAAERTALYNGGAGLAYPFV